MTDVYTPRFYRSIRRGAISSAKVLAPLFVETFGPRSTIDVGCGEGWLVHELHQPPARVAIGLDEHVPAGIRADLGRPPYPTLGPYDLAVCLEVAEHLDETVADTFVGWLVSLAPTVVFSAAVPGQGGDGHVNEQPPSYWVEKFARHGYPGTGVLRDRVWDDRRVCWWYSQNLLVFGAHGLPEDGCPLRTHPIAERWRGGRR